MVDIELGAIEHAQDFQQVALVVRVAAEVGIQRLQDLLPVLAQHAGHALHQVDALLGAGVRMAQHGRLLQLEDTLQLLDRGLVQW